MKVLILSDLHLGRNKGELVTFDTEDCNYALKQLNDVYEKNNIDITVIAGDLVNGTSINDEEQHLLAMLKNILQKYQKNKTYVIRGNHDRAKYDTMQEMFDFIQLTDVPIKISNNHTLSGCNFSDKETHLAYLKENEADILVCHFPMAPFSTFSVDAIPVSDCPKDRIVIVGDTHKPAVYTAHGGLVISPGCLFPKDKSELLSGYAGSAFILSFDEAQKGFDNVDVNHIPLKKRFGVDLTALESVSDVSDRVKLIEASEALNIDLKPVLYIRSSIYQSALDSRLFESFKLFGVPVSEVSNEKEIEVEGLESLDTISIVSKTEEDLFEGDSKLLDIVELTKNLLISDNPKRVVEEFIRGA